MSSVHSPRPSLHVKCFNIFRDDNFLGGSLSFYPHLGDKQKIFSADDFWNKIRKLVVHPIFFHKLSSPNSFRSQCNY